MVVIEVGYSCVISLRKMTTKVLYKQKYCTSKSVGIFSKSIHAKALKKCSSLR